MAAIILHLCVSHGIVTFVGFANHDRIVTVDGMFGSVCGPISRRETWERIFLRSMEIANE